MVARSARTTAVARSLVTCSGSKPAASAAIWATTTRLRTSGAATQRGMRVSSSATDPSFPRPQARSDRSDRRDRGDRGDRQQELAVPLRALRALRLHRPSPQNLLGDGLQLQVGGSFVDLSDLGVAVQLFDGIFLDEAVAAEQIDGE